LLISFSGLLQQALTLAKELTVFLPEPICKGYADSDDNQTEVPVTTTSAISTVLSIPHAEALL
jgi:hypothetical protein